MPARKTPILLRESPLTRQVVAIHRYTRRTLPGGRDVIDADLDGKQDVTHDFLGVMLERLCGDDTGIQPLLVEAALGNALTPGERKRVGDFADRLGSHITEFNRLRDHGNEGGAHGDR